MNNYSMKVDLSVGLFARTYVKENGLTVADPGFRGVGGRGGTNLLFGKMFAENCM